MERGLQTCKGAKGLRLWRGLPLREAQTTVDRPLPAPPPAEAREDAWEER